jgi:tRNA (guanine-N7-)-methyltransferase
MQPVFSLDPEAALFFPESYFETLELGTVFPGRSHLPLEVDIGCGDGTFLIELAGSEPVRNFMGVERLLGRVRRTSRRATRAGLTNLRVLRLESHYVVRYLLPPESVSVFHVMFPDPWPKRRHHHKRLIQTEFLDAVRLALKPGGELRLTTDDLPYYKQMRKAFETHPGFAEEPWEPGEDYPQTDFERIFRCKGLPIYRALLRKAG